jgi:hypothetical protein
MLDSKNTEPKLDSKIENETVPLWNRGLIRWGRRLPEYRPLSELGISCPWAESLTAFSLLLWYMVHVTFTAYVTWFIYPVSVFVRVSRSLVAFQYMLAD